MRSNDLTDCGMYHMSKALERGALPRLELLGLSVTKCHDDGLLQLADAFSEGACPNLRLLYVVNGNFLSKAALVKLEAALTNGRRGKPVMVH